VVANLAQRTVRLTTAKPDVLVTVGTIHTTAARQATDQVPIVFTYIGDPLRSGLVASYASSQNNLTGISVYSGPLSGKRLELLQEIAPDTKRILALVAAKESIAESSFQVLDETAKKLGIQVLRRDDDP
jgi:putative tryptophan/tyrosine transport system substrate-binding protein